MIDWLTFTAGLGLGVYLGWGYRRLWLVVKHNVDFGEKEPAAKLPALRLVDRHAVTVATVMEQPDTREAWDTAVTDYAFWGDLCRWSERRMLAEGIASRPSIRHYRAFLAAARLLIVAERGSTAWAYGWDRHRLRVSLRRRLLSLPYPAHEPWPLRMRWRAGEMAQMAQAGADGADETDDEQA